MSGLSVFLFIFLAPAGSSNPAGPVLVNPNPFLDTLWHFNLILIEPNKHQIFLFFKNKEKGGGKNVWSLSNILDTPPNNRLLTRQFHWTSIGTLPSLITQ